MSEMSIFPLRDQRLTWTIYCVFIALVAGIYFGSLAELMLEVDDARTFRDNVAVAQDFTYLFSSDKEVGSGRLTSDFVRFLAYLLVGNQPGPVHLFVVAVHTLASLLLARLVFRLGLPLNVSLLSGLLFLVNVAQFRAVHWIAALDYPLALLWGCLTLLAYLRYRDQPQPLRLALFYLCLLLSLLTHLVSALVLPFFVYLLWRQQQPLRDCLRHFAWPVILSPLVLYGVLSSTAKTTTTWWAIERYAADGGAELLLGCGRMLLWLLSRMATTAYWLPLPLYEQQEWELYGGAVFLVLLLGLIWKRIYPFDAWALWILMALIPFALLTEGTTNALLAGPSRYIYLATGGTAAMLGWSLVWLGQWISRRLQTKSGYVLVGLLAPLLVSSYVSLKKAEALSFYISSRYYTSSGNNDEGIAQMRRALDRAPEMLRLEDTYVRLISQLFARGEDAQAVIEDALEAFPDDAVLLAQSYILESVSPDSAIRAHSQQKLKQAIKYIPQEELKNYIALVAMSYHNMGSGLYKKDDIEGTIRAYQRTLEVAPERLNTLKQLATLLFFLRYLEEPQSLLAPSPHADAGDQVSYKTYFQLGTLYHRTGQFDQAVIAYRHSIHLHSREGIKLYKKNDIEGAIQAYQKTLEVAPNQSKMP